MRNFDDIRGLDGGFFHERQSPLHSNQSTDIYSLANVRVSLVFDVMPVQFTHPEAFTSKESRPLLPGSWRWRHQAGAPGAQSAGWRHISVAGGRRQRTCCRMSRLRMRAAGRLQRRRRFDASQGRDLVDGRGDRATATAAPTDGADAVLRRRLLLRSPLLGSPEVSGRLSAVSRPTASSPAADCICHYKPSAVRLQWRHDDLTRRSSIRRRKVAVCWRRHHDATTAGNLCRVVRCRFSRNWWLYRPVAIHLVATPSETWLEIILVTLLDAFNPLTHSVAIWVQL